MRVCKHCLRFPYDIGMDKYLHIAVSFLLVMAWGCAVVHIPKWAVLMVAIPWALAIGFLKELYDMHNGGEFSWADILADVVGVVLGAVTMGVVFYL